VRVAVQPDIRVDESVPPAKARKVALSVALGLLVFVALNLVARPVLERYPRNRTYWLIAAKWRLLESIAQPADWLLLGDSSCNQGVRPDLLSRRLGGSAYNLCTVGDMLVVHDAWMLRRHIDEVGPPRNVVLVHVHDVWPRELTERRKGLLARVPLPWGFWDRAEPPLDMDSEQLADLLLARWAPLVTENVTLAGWALSPWNAPPEFHIDDFGYMRNDDANEQAALRDGQRHHEMATTRQPRLSDANRLAIAEIARLAEEHGFHVYVAHAPIVDTAGAKPEFPPYLARIEALVRQAANNSPRLSFVLDPPVTFPPSVMENADHLTHDAAATYTERLSQAIQALR
jgi:hypothetical protein